MSTAKKKRARCQERVVAKRKVEEVLKALRMGDL